MFKRIFFFFKNVRGSFALSALFAACAAVLQLLLPFFMGTAIDSIHGKGTVDFALLAKYTLMMGGVVIGCALFHWLTKFFSNKMAFSIGKAIRTDLMRKAHRLPIAYYDTAAHGDLLSRVTNDVETITEGIQNAS